MLHTYNTHEITPILNLLSKGFRVFSEVTFFFFYVLVELHNM